LNSYFISKYHNKNEFVFYAASSLAALFLFSKTFQYKEKVDIIVVATH